MVTAALPLWTVSRGRSRSENFRTARGAARSDLHDAANRRPMPTAPKCVRVVQPRARRECQRAEAAGPSRAADMEEATMRMSRGAWLSCLASLAVVTAASAPAAAQQQKPNILFIMGDDIGW